MEPHQHQNKLKNRYDKLGLHKLVSCYFRDKDLLPLCYAAANLIYSNLFYKSRLQLCWLGTGRKEITLAALKIKMVMCIIDF